MKNKVRHCLFFPKPRDRSRKIRSLPSVLRLFAAPPDLQRAPRTSPATLWAAISAPDGSISLPRLRSERCFAPDWSTRCPKMIQKSVSMLPKTVMARIKHASQTAIHEASGGLPNKNYFHRPSRPRNRGHQTTAKPKSTKLQPTVSAAPLLDRKKHEFWAWIGPHFGAHWATPKLGPPCTRQ